MEKIMLFIITLIMLGAFCALLTNGVIEGMKNLPLIKDVKGAPAYALMLAVSASITYVLYRGSAHLVNTSFWLLWITSAAAAQLGYDKLIKNKVEKEIS